jgi:hypothetical protein
MLGVPHPLFLHEEEIIESQLSTRGVRVPVPKEREPISKFVLIDF